MGGLIRHLLHTLQTDHLIVKYEAVWAIGNAIIPRDKEDDRSRDADVDWLATAHRCIGPLCEFFSCCVSENNLLLLGNQKKVMLHTIEALKNILRIANTYGIKKTTSWRVARENFLVKEFESNLEHIRSLQILEDPRTSKDTELSNKIKGLIFSIVDTLEKFQEQENNDDANEDRSEYTMQET